MPAHLQNEAAVAALVKELITRRPAYRQAAEDERSGGVGASLIAVLASQPDYCDALGLAQLLLRDQQICVGPGEQLTDGLHHGTPPLQSRYRQAHNTLTIASRNPL